MDLPHLIKNCLRMDQGSLESALYLVATPIGNLEDITLRALRILRNADKIYCEDTRVSQKLLEAYQIKKPLSAYHDHNADKVRPKILNDLASGLSVALISDAGMPLISDPGYKLVKACYEAFFKVVVIPGPSSVLTGLAFSGLPTDQFTFCGFYSSKKREFYQSRPETLILFEAPHRIVKTLEELAEIFPQRPAVLTRELTKKFEERRQGSVEDLRDYYLREGPPKGEIVLLLGPWEVTQGLDLDTEILSALKQMSVKEASEYVSIKTKMSKKKIYARALELRGQNESP